MRASTYGRLWLIAYGFNFSGIILAALLHKWLFLGWCSFISVMLFRFLCEDFIDIREEKLNDIP